MSKGRVSVFPFVLSREESKMPTKKSNELSAFEIGQIIDQTSSDGIWREISHTLLFKALGLGLIEKIEQNQATPPNVIAAFRSEVKSQIKDFIGEIENCPVDEISQIIDDFRYDLSELSRRSKSYENTKRIIYKLTPTGKKAISTFGAKPRS